MLETKAKKQPFYIILILILCGEAVFILPFVLARIFRPTLLESLNINNEQLGYCFSTYGVVALLSYLFGGPLADKYHPRYLMSSALILTGLGGFYLATYPSYSSLKILYGFWGFTTIFLFWAAMIKATRIWGGENKQGMAFGFLDGGRGLVAAGFGTLGLIIFTMIIGDATGSSDNTSEAFKSVITTSSFIVCTIGILSFFFLKPLTIKNHLTINNNPLSIENVMTALKIPAVWYLMIIVMCAYFGYKTTDIFSLYAKDVMLYDDIDSAKVGTYLLYMRPIIGIIIGLLADKTKATLWLIFGFALTLITSLIFASGILSDNTSLLFKLSIVLIALGVYSTRVLYFATMEEGKIPLAITGTAVGLLSIIGFTPDIFSGPIIGYLLDNSPGELGHQHVFLVLSIFAIIGLVTSYLFYKSTKPVHSV